MCIRDSEYRVKDAKHLLTDKRYADNNVEEISTMVGFANRQSFYAAFYKNVGETPNAVSYTHLMQVRMEFARQIGIFIYQLQFGIAIYKLCLLYTSRCV